MAKQRKKREVYEIDPAIIADNAEGDSLKMNFATGLNRLLSQKGIDQGTFAKETGFSTGAVSNYRNGKKLPKTEEIVRIANYLGVDTHYLLTGVPAKYANIGDIGLSGKAVEAIARGFMNPDPEFCYEFSRREYLGIFNKLISHPDFVDALDLLLILEQCCSESNGYEYEADDYFFTKRSAEANKAIAQKTVYDISNTLREIKCIRYEIAESFLGIISDMLNIDKHKKTMESISSRMLSIANAPTNQNKFDTEE